MPDLKDSMVQALRNGKPVKGVIKRDAFLYLEGKQDNFAQCSSCCLLTPDNECTILGMKVDPEWTCGLYVPGAYNGSDVEELISAEDAGLLKQPVRCENCRFGGGNCKLFEQLNKQMPSYFDLDPEIEPKGCCNAFTGK